MTQKTPKGFDRILMDYNNGKEVKHTSLTTNALQDWDKPIGDDSVKSFKILREVIANAYDEDKNFTIEMVNKIEPPVEGYTSVYLGWLDEYNIILQNSERYFKFLNGSTALQVFNSDWKDGRIALYPCSDKNHIRVFIQGVLIYCKKGFSAFDYCIYEKELLSEERIVKDYEQMLDTIYWAFDCAQQAPHLVKEIIPVLLVNSFESEIINSQVKDYCGPDFYEAHQQEQSIWKKAWIDIFGEKMLLGEPDSDIGRDAEYMGYQIARCEDNNVRYFLNSKGVPNTWAVCSKLREKIPVEWDKLSKTQQDSFNQAVQILKNTYPDFEMPEVVFFKQEKDTDGGERIEDKIWLNITILSKGFLEVIRVIAHEYRHLKTGKSDYDRDFIQSADQLIAQLLLKINNLQTQ